LNGDWINDGTIEKKDNKIIARSSD
jgi:hypothetical protein